MNTLKPSPSLRGEAEAIQQTAVQAETSLDCFASARNDGGGKRHGETRSYSALPEGWAYCSVSQVTLKTQMWNLTKDKRNAIKYIDVSAVNREKSLIEDVTEYQTDNAPGRARKIVRTGDTIFATIRPSLRRIVNIPIEFDNEIASTAFCVLRPDPKKIDPDFLFFAVSSEWFIEAVVNLETGASYPAVRDRDIFEQKIPLPLFAEQKQIASVLLQIRKSLLNTYKAFDNAQALKRAAMREVFTRGLRGEAQKQTEIGLVPESWEVKPFINIIVLQRGFDLPTQNRKDGSIPVVGSNGVVGFHNDTKGNVPVPGLTIVGRSGSVGLITYQENEYWPLNTVLYGKAFFGNIPKFLSYWLELFPFKQYAQGVSVPTLNRNSLSAVPFPVPTIDEQSKIVTLLSAIDDKITLHKRKKAALEALFTSLLHQLMTGAIRVGDLDLSSLNAPQTEAE